MLAQQALKHQYLSVIAAASISACISGLISVVGGYLITQPVNDTLARHETLLQDTKDTLARHERLHQETNGKLNELQRMLRKKTRCFML
jgi:hypothetical protein